MIYIKILLTDIILIIVLKATDILHLPNKLDKIFSIIQALLILALPFLALLAIWIWIKGFGLLFFEFPLNIKYLKEENFHGNWWTKSTWRGIGFFKYRKNCVGPQKQLFKYLR